MTKLKITMTKQRDGSVVSRFERSDGTIACQHKRWQHARFFALHDLERYAIETVLGYRRGFYGLVAEGWDLEDFGSPWPRGPLPRDAELAEVIVAFLGVERTIGRRLTAADVNEQAALHYSGRGLAHVVALTDDELTRIRAAVQGLRTRWDELADGATLELTFSLD